MKNKTHHLFYLYYPSGLISLRRNGPISLCKSGFIIISLLMLFSILTEAQEQTLPPGDFIVGSPIKHKLRDYQNLLDPFEAAGFNTIWNRADYYTENALSNFNLLAENSESASEYINHYTTAYYSKWEAEENQIDSARVGIKHYDRQGNTFGEVAFWDSAWCWSTNGLSAPACSLMYGPHYRQDTRYKRWQYDWQNYKNVMYVPRFRMALDKSQGVSDSEDVCVIKAVFRYKIVYSENSWEYIDSVFLKRTLKVSDFDSNEGWTEIKFTDPNEWYKYPSEFILPAAIENMANPPGYPYITYSESYTGIQFWVDWLRSDTLCTLYIDYAEVYDNNGWDDFIVQPEQTANLIKLYAQNFPASEWPNLKYWSGVDEPYSIDCYTPIRVVDELIRSAQAPPLVVHFDPSWWDPPYINGEDEIAVFDSIAKPSKIILGMYPCSPNWPVIRKQDFDWLAFNFQRTSLHDSSFWFKPQAFGYRTNYPNNPPEWCIWRKPNSSELTSMVMLALAHGAKGILFEWFDSFPYDDFDPCPNTYIECLVKENGDPEVLNAVDTLYSTVKNKLVPRLKGKLGKTLMSLDYTGDFLQLQHVFNQQNPNTVTYDYLTLELVGLTGDHNWHCGFFSRQQHLLDNYFMLDNLITTYDRTIKVTIDPPYIEDYPNYRFRNVEGLFDTTMHSDNFTMQIDYEEGEGYLYQVAPVVEYGGRLLYPESVGGGMVLNDDMIIENGATLTVYDNYNANANITVKNGTILVGENGRINFGEGKKLIIAGTCNISGTSDDKLQLVFSEPINDDPTGIMIKAGGSLTANYCIIEDATIGIQSLLNANYLNIQNVEFIDCETHSISIAGQSGGMNPTPPPQINYCTIKSSLCGILISNLSSIIIQNNTITNTDCGISLSNVTDAQITGNMIQSNTEELQGIFSSSSGGAIRANYISGHTYGIHLANSSPALGSNVMTENKYHGLYIGNGSLPYMRIGSFIGNPPVFYAASGYNKIFENGGYQEIGGPPDNDGSEIYFYNSNAVMDKGCNSIYDDRQTSPPLINTLLLMSGYRFGFPITIQAQYNFWGDTVYTSRFSGINVNYIPYETNACPEPQGGGGEEELVMMNQFGDVIDTVYSTGEEITGLSSTELAYAEAEGYFLTGDLTNALQIYEAIINSTATEEEKHLAYKRKYSIGKLTGQSTEYFNQLSNTFIALSSNSQDSLSKKILAQFSTLSKVGEQEYETAIGEFDEVIQQNPNTEEAVYAEIDALTTALLVEDEDSTLQKGRLGKYLVKTSGDYNQRIDEILRKNFGNESKETEEEILPTEYTLYQNYPNPFNPTTTIKYDLPFASDVSLNIYDILGRKVKELVNTKLQAGRYEIQFNASNLASGVYIYQLIA